MNSALKVAGLLVAVVVLVLPDLTTAQAGHVHRATRRRTAVVVSSATHASDANAAAASSASAQQSTAAQQSATAQQQSATAAQQSATAQQQTAAAAKPAAAPAAAGALAVGTVASTLPSGCATSAVSGVEYYHCGNDWYRSAFQGNTLVYVTTAPPQ